MTVTLFFELILMKSYAEQGRLEIGVDEAGRGPFLGRVYAAAVVWPPDLTNCDLVRDSKKYKNREEREKAYNFIMDNCISYGVGYCEPEEIDKSGITKCVTKAMHTAIHATKINPDYLLIDGNYFKVYTDMNDDIIPFSCIIDGDNKYYSIAAASVIAKVDHDRYIMQLLADHPELEDYGIRKGMGYGTAQHREAIQNFGLTPFHRASFCKKYVSQSIEDEVEEEPDVIVEEYEGVILKGIIF